MIQNLNEELFFLSKESGLVSMLFMSWQTT